MPECYQTLIGTSCATECLAWTRRGEPRRIDDGPEMHDPAHENEPQCRCEYELYDRHSKTTLEKLPQTGNEKAAQRRKNVSAGTLPCHLASFPCA